MSSISESDGNSPFLRLLHPQVQRLMHNIIDRDLQRKPGLNEIDHAEICEGCTSEEARLAQQYLRRSEQQQKARFMERVRRKQFAHLYDGFVQLEKK